jgi:DNA polymerase-3 subunit delta
VSFSAEKVLKKRVVMLSGEEEQLRRRALQSMFETLGVQKDDFDLEFTSGDATKPVDWYASAGTAPFMAERRIVVVRSLLRRDIDDLKGVNLATLPETALLILVADEESASSDDKSRKISTWRTKWQKAVQDAGGHVEDFKLEAKAAKETIKAEALKAGKKFSPNAIDLLLDMTGGSVSKALDELDKLITFTGKSEQISENHVREIVVPSREWNVFRMIDSIVSGAVPEALRQLRILVGSQPKSEDAAIGRVLPMVGRTLRLLWQARICVDAKCPVGNPPAEIQAQFPEKPNIMSEQPYRQSSMVSAAQKVSLDNIARCLQILADTDARLKGSLPSFSTMDTLERMVLEMSKILAPGR